MGLGRGGVREIFDYLIIKWRIFDLWYSEVLIFLSAALQRKAEYTYKYRPKTRTKGGTYMKEPNQSTLQLQQFRLQNEVESSGFLSKCAEHVVLRGQCSRSRWHCSNRSTFSQTSVMVKRIDVSVRCNLEYTRA